MSSAPTPSNIVIVGGGIIGVCTAYYTSLHPSLPPNTSITIIEATSVASGASGKAGGLLAEDWHGGATSGLGQLSYRLHGELAEQFGGEKAWGYRKVETLVCVFSPCQSRHSSRTLDSP